MYEGNYYDKYGSKNFIVKHIMNGYYDNFKLLILSKTFKNILDVGCGEGIITNYIKSLVNDVEIQGMDVSENIISKAKGSFPDINFTVGSIQQIDIPSNSYDLVTACEVLEHVENPLAALEELFRVSKKYVIVSVPNEPTWRISNMIRGKYTMNLGNTPGHIQHWSKKHICNLVQRYGEILEIKSPFPWTMLLCKKGTTAINNA